MAHVSIHRWLLIHSLSLSRPSLRSRLPPSVICGTLRSRVRRCPENNKNRRDSRKRTTATGTQRETGTFCHRESHSEINIAPIMSPPSLRFKELYGQFQHIVYLLGRSVATAHSRADAVGGWDAEHTVAFSGYISLFSQGWVQTNQRAKRERAWTDISFAPR